MKQLLPTPWRVFPQATLPVACLTTYLFLVSCAVLVVTPALSQDVLWGLTNSQGPGGGGTAFSIGSTGADFTLRKIFTKAPGSPMGDLVQGRDGYFYGMTRQQGEYVSNLYGTVFKISPAGTLTVLKSFGFYDGAYPAGNLVQGQDGDFYGMTEHGGKDFRTSFGTIFKISPEGKHTVLKHLSDSEGANPRGSLVLARDGNFYGMTSSGGNHGQGTIFKISPAGSYTVLKHFTGADGSYPYGSLVQGRDGDFYGMTSGGGKQPGYPLQNQPGGHPCRA